jgi:hypothetical protein
MPFTNAFGVSTPIDGEISQQDVVNGRFLPNFVSDTYETGRGAELLEATAKVVQDVVSGPFFMAELTRSKTSEIAVGIFSIYDFNRLREALANTSQWGRSYWKAHTVAASIDTLITRVTDGVEFQDARLLAFKDAMSQTTGAVSLEQASYITNRIWSGPTRALAQWKYAPRNPKS